MRARIDRGILPDKILSFGMLTGGNIDMKSEELANTELYFISSELKWVNVAVMIDFLFFSDYHFNSFGTLLHILI